MFCYPRLKDVREDHDLTQGFVGELLKTTQQQYSKYEKGLQEIPVHHLITLAEYYHVSTDYLLGRTDEPQGPAERRDAPAGAQIRRP